MIRVSKHSLKFSNKEKIQKLDNFFELYKLTLIDYINQIKVGKLPLKIMLSTKLCPDSIIKHSRYKQLAYKQASEIIRSNLIQIQKRTYNKYKKLYYKCIKNNIHKSFTDKHFKDLNINYLKRININLKNLSITLNENLFNVQEGNSFDEFIKVFLPWFKEGKKRAETINLPLKQHKHSLNFKNNNWLRKSSIQLEVKNNKYYLNIFWEKELVKTNNQLKIGIDQGYNKLISDSNGVHWGKELKEIYIKLTKKKRGSKNYKQLLTYKRNKINEVVNRFIETYKDTDIVCEDLKRVKHASKLYKSTNNKLQYWSYKQVLDKLNSLSELKGFKLIKVEPAYTSQTCSNCGQVIKANRQGELYSCSCGLLIDADTNAAINILNRGVYCPSTQQT
ncbi:MAG: transposase [Treponema sp.]|nr:transposase [Clostridia bacterium]MBP3608485.1 transposase [Treponema sp.]